MIRYQTDDEGVVSQPEYTLTKPSNGPNDRDHLRDDLSRPVDHRQGTLFPSAQGVPFQVATGSLFMLPLPTISWSARRRSFGGRLPIMNLGGEDHR